jgi:predicted DNA-binding transcriptional regulator AlpA
VHIGFSIVRVDHDLVDIPEIAERLHRSRQVVHKWAVKDVCSSFPRPVGSPGGKRIWPWFEVLNWYRTNKDPDAPRGLLADDAAQVDTYLAARRDRVMAWSGLRLVDAASPAKRDNSWPGREMEYQERPLQVVGLMTGTGQ